MKYKNGKRIAVFLAMTGITALASGCGGSPPVPAPVPIGGTTGMLTTGSCVPIMLSTSQSYASTPTGLSVTIQNGWMNSNSLAAGNVAAVPMGSGIVQPAPAGAYGTVIQGPGAGTLPVANGLTMFSTVPNPATSPDGAVVLSISSIPSTLTSGYSASYPGSYLTAAGSRWNGTGMVQISALRIQEWLSSIGYSYYNTGYTTIGVTQPQAMTACVNSVAINLSYTNVTGTNTLYAGYVSIGATLSATGGAQQHGFTLKF